MINYKNIRTIIKDRIKVNLFSKDNNKMINIYCDNKFLGKFSIRNKNFMECFHEVKIILTSLSYVPISEITLQRVLEDILKQERGKGENTMDTNNKIDNYDIALQNHDFDARSDNLIVNLEEEDLKELGLL